MKKTVLVIALLNVLNLCSSAQRSMRPLTGNGIEKQINYDLKAFETLEILWVDGTIEVEYGAPKSDISILTDENIFNLMDIQNTEGVLKIALKNNYRNRLWVEDDKTKIKIRTTAQPQQITYKANANAEFKGINTVALSIDKDENGDIFLAGKAAQLTVLKSDNGNINAEYLKTETASIDMSGNGNVTVTAKNITKQIVKGNGNFRNTETNPTTPKITVQRVRVTFYNPDIRRKEYYVTGPNERGSRFSYGLGLEALGRQSEYLPIGTMIYRKGKLIATLKASDNLQEVKL